jgi:HEAT repeats
MQRSWRYEPAILDAIASRVDEESAYTYVIRLIEYLTSTWRDNPKALDLVLKLAGPKAKASFVYSYASVLQAAARALAQGWRSEAYHILRDWARNHQNVYGHIAALQVIAESWHDDPTTLPFLQDLATNTPTATRRSHALEAMALGWAGDAQALAFLKDRTTNEPIGQTRAAALWAIRRGWGSDAQVLAFLKDWPRTIPRGLP